MIRIKKMNLKIKLFDGGRTPTYKTEGSACADCYCRIDDCDGINIPPQSSVLVNLGFALEIPEGYEVCIEPRSSFAFKEHGLVIHGEIDSDYRGELKANVFNMDNTHYLHLVDGDRICQIKLLPVNHMYFEPAKELSATDRGVGGFGSTGR